MDIGSELRVIEVTDENEVESRSEPVVPKSSADDIGSGDMNANKGP
jgi:hypothetical protein